MTCDKHDIFDTEEMQVQFVFIQIRSSFIYYKQGVSDMTSLLSANFLKQTMTQTKKDEITKAQLDKLDSSLGKQQLDKSKPNLIPIKQTSFCYKYL